MACPPPSPCCPCSPRLCLNVSSQHQHTPSPSPFSHHHPSHHHSHTLATNPHPPLAHLSPSPPISPPISPPPPPLTHPPTPAPPQVECPEGPGLLQVAAQPGGAQRRLLAHTVRAGGPAGHCGAVRVWVRHVWVWVFVCDGMLGGGAGAARLVCWQGVGESAER